MLAKHEFDYVVANHCELCGAYDPNACAMDWPFNDVPNCSEYDTMVNGLKGLFAGSGTIPDVAVSNLLVLGERKAAQNGCMNY